MVAGRKPKTREQRQRTGNAGKRPLPAQIKTSDRLETLPEPPETLTEAGKEAWRVVGGPMVDAQALRQAHLPVLLMFSQAVALSQSAWADLQEEGYVREGKRNTVISPAFRVWETATSQALRFGEHLGATPVAMARLGLAALKGKTLHQRLAERHAAGVAGGRGPRS